MNIVYRISLEADNDSEYLLVPQYSHKTRFTPSTIINKLSCGEYVALADALRLTRMPNEIQDMGVRVVKCSCRSSLFQARVFKSHRSSFFIIKTKEGYLC